MLWWVCAAIGIAGVLAALSIAYPEHFPNLGSVNDTWFGSDVQRHVAWVLQLQWWARFHLRPASFLVFKVWGLFLRGAGASPPADTLIVFALPAIVLTALGLAACAALLAPRGRYSAMVRTAVLLVLVLVGPVVAFGPMPESPAGLRYCSRPYSRRN